MCPSRGLPPLDHFLIRAKEVRLEVSQLLLPLLFSLLSPSFALRSDVVLHKVIRRDFGTDSCQMRQLGIVHCGKDQSYKEPTSAREGRHVIEAIKFACNR